MKYSMELNGSDSLKRILTLVRKHYDIMEILNEDSEKAVDGGAGMYYDVKIEFEEKWG